MTGQPRLTSAMEAAAQAVVGFPIGWGVCFAVGLLGLSAAASASLITFAMFVASIIRGYVVRRRFERVGKVIEVSSVFDAHDDAMEPLGSHNWEPPAFKRGRR